MGSCAIKTDDLPLTLELGKDGMLYLHEKATIVDRIGGFCQLEGPPILETRRYGTEHCYSHLFILLGVQHGIADCRPALGL